jgi:soluble epoxide hydrolase/lipid-phosphate phosphatase
MRPEELRLRPVTSIMDSSLYNTHKTSRGLTYNYYHSPAKGDNITLVFHHGYPSTSADWYKQVAFFIERGYGVVVPDQLGYGGSDKPTLEELDKLSTTLIAKDIIELLELEKVGRAISIGHDWEAHKCIMSWCTYAYTATPQGCIGEWPHRTVVF